MRVVDASRVLAGPYLAMLLGDLGADVVKVERPEVGDPTRGWGPPFVGGSDGEGERVSAYFVAANRNKRSVVLDLKAAAGRRAFGRLLASADVLVENFLPGEWRKLGFRRTDFTRSHPRLVQVTITGYGAAGPDADRPAYDLVLQAESGLMSVTGFAEGEPVRVGVAIVDVLAALYGLSGVLAALLARQTSGCRGSRVEVAMADAGAAFLSYAAQSWIATGEQPPRLGSRHPNLAPYQAFQAADGWLVVGVGSEEQWRRFCAAIDRPDLLADPRFAANADRVRNRAALDALLAERFGRRTTAQWQAALRAARVPAAPLAGIGEAVKAARARGQVLPLPAGAHGALETLAAPWLLAGTRPAPSRPAPALGQHTVEVLREAGLSEQAIGRLVARDDAAPRRPPRRT